MNYAIGHHDYMSVLAVYLAARSEVFGILSSLYRLAVKCLAVFQVLVT